MISGWLTAMTYKRLVGFLFSPAGKFVVALLAFFVWTVYQRMDATADCVAKQEAEAILESNRQAEIAKEIAAKARDRADQTEAELAELGKAYESLKNDIETGALGSCPIPDSLRERLLRIK